MTREEYLDIAKRLKEHNSPNRDIVLAELKYLFPCVQCRTDSTSACWDYPHCLSISKCKSDKVKIYNKDGTPVQCKTCVHYDHDGIWSSEDGCATFQFADTEHGNSQCALYSRTIYRAKHTFSIDTFDDILQVDEDEEFALMNVTSNECGLLFEIEGNGLNIQLSHNAIKEHFIKTSMR